MLQTAVQNDPSAVLRRYDFARALTLRFIVLVALIAVVLPLISAGPIGETLTAYQVFRQDLPLLALFLCAFLLRPTAGGGSAAGRSINSVPMLAFSALAILLAGWIGQQAVFQGLALSRDEQMAVFDQGIFEHGRLIWPIATEWRSVADALNRSFMLPIGANEYWVSGYLPVHAAFRAALGSIGLSSMASPLLAALGAVGMWLVARRLWPQSHGTVIVSLILLVTSSQVLITSMTAFSMSMHLALNLLWLACFLANRRSAHVLAALVAFLATGIHQPLFHPLFAMPFVLLLAWQGRWRLFAFYGIAYAIICLFWLAWPVWIAAHGAAPPPATATIGYVDRLVAAVKLFDLNHVWFTAANLLRFICWQHPILLPLALFGAISCWREPLVKALVVSFVLPIVVMAIILPWQGHGWGYRYLHPVLGNAILLACFGFRKIEKSGLSLRRPLIITTAIAVLILPLHALMAARVAQPFADVRKELAEIPADVVIVDIDGVPYGQDVVFNRFDLSNRPRLLIASLLKPDDLPGLCRRSTIAFYYASELAAMADLFGAPIASGPSPRARRLHHAAAAARCRIVRVPA